MVLGDDCVVGVISAQNPNEVALTPPPPFFFLLHPPMPPGTFYPLTDTQSNRLLGACFWLALVLTSTRLIRGWNQTGQKFAGAPDIVKTFIVSNPKFLWALIVATYAWIQRRITQPLGQNPRSIGVSLVGVLVFLAFTFKLAFTSEDSPELMVKPISSLHGAIPQFSLVSSARMVFVGIFGMGAYAVFLSIRGGSQARQGYGMSPIPPVFAF